MSLKFQRVIKRKDEHFITGVILDEEPDPQNCVLVHWGVADGNRFRTIENLDQLEQIESPPRPVEGPVGWEE